jgi:hypothetical protein
VISSTSGLGPMSMCKPHAPAGAVRIGEALDADEIRALP